MTSALRVRQTVRIEGGNTVGHPERLNSETGTVESYLDDDNNLSPVWKYIPILSTTLVVLQLLIYFFVERFGVGSEEDVFISWKTVVTQREYWRLFAAHFIHFGRVHVLLNCLSLFCFGRYLERKIQWLPLLILVEAIGIGANILFLMINKYVAGYQEDISTFGFSHIHFGLRILLAYMQEPRNYEPSLLLGLYPAYLSPLWAPWQPLLEVTILKLIVQELNITGQLSGILIGFIVSFLLKIFPPRLVYTERFVAARRGRQ